MSSHVIKYDYEDGKKLINPILWCGQKHKHYMRCFTDAGHLSLSVGGSIQPCKNCVKAIIKKLQKEL